MTVPERQIVEAVLLVADEPVSAGLLGELLERPRPEVEALLAEIAAAYAAEARGWVLREVAGGWRLYSSPDCAPWLERFARRGASGRLTAAALEVLAIVAYRGPLSRAGITEIRGVDSDGVVRTLLQRGLVGETRAGGGAAQIAVTATFLDQLGLSSVEDLPPLTDFMPDAEAVEDMEARLTPPA